MTLRGEILRRLVTEYQEHRDSIVFEKILRRVDALLLSTVHKHMWKRPHLQKIDMRDLYHTAIVSLGRAIITMKPEFTPERIVQRIISYVKNELNVTYPLNTIHRFYTFVSLDATAEYHKPHAEQIQEQNHAERTVELGHIRELYAEAIEEDIITQADFDLMVLRFVDQEKYIVIAKKLNLVIGTVRDRCEMLRLRMRSWLQNHGVEG